MKRLAPLAIALTFAALACGPALGQGQDFSKVEIKVTDLGHNIYMLQGAGGNMTAAVGSDGIILVDAEFAPMHAKIKAALAKISPLPVKFLINTHYHVDHTGGNEAFGKEGTIIVAHENVAKRLAVPPPSATGHAAPPAPKAAMPAQTYSGQGTEVKIGGQTAELIHIEHAHTDGDTMVFWKDADVISSGDIVGSAAYPGIDVAADGSLGGMIDGAQFIVDHSDAKTKIVPGHGPLFDRKGMIEYLKMLKTARTRIAAAKAKGMTEDQWVKSNPMKDFDKRWAAPQSVVAVRFPITSFESKDWKKQP